ncbi:F-box protein AFR [Neltuma alba]|uniref:F-box protein AFR n=1 Tax=Neltuma alba TaxID=207710 RepID=UPI0010A36961|nr:F-box protein AFR [Prosopis alba]
MKITHEETSDKDFDSEDLIPGLPNEVARLCLLHLPYPYQALARSISSSWNRAITDPTFLLSKKSLSLSRPYLFVLTSHKSTARMQWQALDPSSGSWFVLPPMPSPKPLCPQSFACASLPRQGKLIVMGGMRRDTQTPMDSTFVYRTTTNQWSQLSPMPTARSYFTAAEIDGKIMAVGGTGARMLNSIKEAEIYDPERDAWESRSRIEAKMGKYDSAVMGGRLYVTEGWTWPFMFSPRAAVYDGGSDRWEEMRQGMREGWTGVSAVVEGRMITISEYGDCPVKAYDEERDVWEYVKGDRFPREKLERPLTVRGEEGRIYVVASKLNVGIGRVEVEVDRERGKEVVKVTWEVVEAPKAFAALTPCSSQVLYA